MWRRSISRRLERGPGFWYAARSRRSPAHAGDDARERVDEHVDLGRRRHHAERSGTTRLEQDALVEETDEHGLRYLRVARHDVAVVPDRPRREMHAEERRDPGDLRGHAG